MNHFIRFIWQGHASRSVILKTSVHAICVLIQEEVYVKHLKIKLSQALTDFFQGMCHNAKDTVLFGISLN